MDEDEAALLAELRAISAGAAGTSRFNDDNNDGLGDEDNVQNENNDASDRDSPNENLENNCSTGDISQSNMSQGSSSSYTELRKNSNSSRTAPAERPLPPWKRGGQKQEAPSSYVDKEVVAAPKVPTPPDSPPISNNGGGFQKEKSSFQGDRGGDAEDEDLLAELRAISQKSGAFNRFADGEEQDGDNNYDNNNNDDDDMLDNLLGDEGNDAHKVSPPRPEDGPMVREKSKLAQRTSGNSRFDSKRGMDVLVTSSSEDHENVSVMTEPSAFMGGGGFQKRISKDTFQGERGGAAEDEDLLAELRAISAKSSSAERFAGEENEKDEDQHDDGAFAATLEDSPTTGPKKQSLPPWKRKQNQSKPNITTDTMNSGDDEDIVIAAPTNPLDDPDKSRDDGKPLPPWKQKGKASVAKQNLDVDVVVAAPPAPEMNGGGFQKPTMPNTFQGERGGTAEDEELLRELRAISSKSASVDRFAGEGDDNEEGGSAGAFSAEVEPTMAEPLPEPKQTDVLPPWKRERPTKTNPKATATPEIEIVVAAPPTRATGGFQKESTPTTFQGERGGAAEDEDLLAELRAISSQSGAVDRFAQDDNGLGNDVLPDSAENGLQHEQADVAPAQKVASLPPWKQKGKKQASPDVDVVVAAPSSRKTESTPPWKRKTSQNQQPTFDAGEDATPPVPSESRDHEAFPQDGGFQKPSLPNTFQGERGGSAEDADLLAELKAISAGAGGASRFAHEDGTSDVDNGGFEGRKDTVEVPPSKPANTNALPPWKRKGNQADERQTADVQVSVEAPLAHLKPPETSDSGPSAPFEVVQSVEPTPSPSMGGFQKPDLPNTFKGERGGTAEDADLLAELRAISAGASSANRFAGGDDEDGFDTEGVPMQHSPPPPKKPVSTAPKPKPAQSKELPPWKKRGSAPINKPPSSDVDSGVEAPATTISDQPTQMGGFQKPSNQPSTFKGDRGGAAEDEELLRELMAISAGTGAANRFAENDDGMEEQPMPPPPKPKARPKPQPPRAAKPVAAPSSNPPAQMGGFQKPSNQPSTFKGDRGGAAEDEELLRELMAISAGTGAANRFAENDDGMEEQPMPPPPKPKARPKPQPPRAAKPVAAPSSNPPAHMGGFQKPSNQPSTFKGDRGGAAEDEELLRELMAISAGTGAANRFAGSDEDGMEEQPEPPPKRSAQPRTQPPRAAKSSAATSSGGPTVVQTNLPSAADFSLTMDDLPAALSNKNWKTRKEAYQLLHRTLGNEVTGKEATGEFEAGNLVEGLDSLVPGMLSDSNAGALDSALEFSLFYADYCRGATMAGQAEEMLAALVKGSALSSSRPSTAKLTSELVMKLIEVGEDGMASAHAVVDVLLRHGVTSKKPKVVVTAAGLILLAANSFGAACLPIAQVTSSAPKLLSHSNAKVRENGMEITAEIARALGSTSHIQGILDGLKKAQTDQLNAMIEQRPQPAPISVGFRSNKGASSSASPEDALAALAAGTKELEAKRFASRPAINLVAEVAKTDYATRLTHAKWSEKTAALDKVLECGGEKPYKLMEPSSSVNYAPLISDMKKLLAHTHFAVNGKAMQVLSMLAEGVGEKLFPYLRPLVGTLLALSKDKKLTKFIAPCLDSFFGLILSFDHLLEEDVLPEAVDEKKQKNALARTSALDFLRRCVTRGESAGPRGVLTVKTAKKVAAFSISKLEDSDAGARKEALSVLQSMQAVEDEDVADAVNDMIDGLKKTNARAHKTLTRTMKAKSKPAATSAKEDSSSSTEHKKHSPTKTPAAPDSASAPGRNTSPTQTLRRPPSGSREAKTHVHAPKPVSDGSCDDEMALEDAIDFMAQLDIPKFEEPLDNDGVLAGLKSTKWSTRQNAIKNLAGFLESIEPSTSSLEIEKTSASMLVAVKEHTRGFKETNVNVTKAILEFFIAICDYHYGCSQSLMSWAMSDIVTLAVDKISDKKLSALAKGLLTNTCLVCRPHAVVSVLAANVAKAKSPLSHEECQHWFKTFCNDFGAASLGNAVKDVSEWLLKESNHSNIKVKKAALASIGTLHIQLGPIFRALIMSQCKEPARAQLEKTLDGYPYDASSPSAEWPKVSIASSSKSSSRHGASSGDDGDDTEHNDTGLSIEIPRMDLLGAISRDCATKMASKDGKTAWKIRKQAIDEVDSALSKCSSLIDTSPESMKPLAELLRALRDRLSDSQGNLKPFSARVIGSFFSVTDAAAQAKFGKLVYAPLMNAAMTDIKKPMRDSSLEALRLSVTKPTIEGGGCNKDALDSFMNSLSGEINETALKAIGLPDLLDLVLSFAEHVPNLDQVVVTRGQSLGEKTAHALVKCLTSSKSETRSKAEELLTICVKNEVINLEVVRSGTERMKPAQQRSIGPIMAKLGRLKTQGEKENVPDRASSNEEAAHGPVKSSSNRTRNQKPERHAHATTSTKREDHMGAGTQVKGHAPRSPRKDISVHPLITASGPSGLEKARSALRSMTWPEYPEEPLGSDIFNQLKRAWSAVLPATSAASIFPAGGIRNQDDGKTGCELLEKAILMERSGEGVAIEEQLEYILRWIVIVLCSKEHTVGLQALLTLLNNLFVYLHDIKYEISDSEALLLVPFVFEKASLAKGRFKEVFDDLIKVMKSEDVLPGKRLGSVVSVAMIERASHSKARLAGAQDCAKCVDELGLSGIGKKGVLVAAKALSEETLSENRSACLELMVLILGRMNGDIQRLARICGSSLSDKARRLVEERWQRRSKSGGGVPPRPIEDTSGRRSKIPTPQKGSPPEKPQKKASPPKPLRLSPRNLEGSSSTLLHDELPALNLRTRGPSPAKDVGSSTSDILSSSSKNFLAGFNASTDSLGLSFSSTMLLDDNSTRGYSSKSKLSLPSSTLTSQKEETEGATDSTVARRESYGAAASLRARLLKIREKSKNPDSSFSALSPVPDSNNLASTTQPKPVSPIATPITSSSSIVPAADVHLPSITEPAERPEPASIVDASDNGPSTAYITGMKCIEDLLSKPIPLDEADVEMYDALETMKKFHSAFSKQQNGVAADLMKLRLSITQNPNQMIERFSLLIRFSLECERSDKNAGISVSLLSVCLATLMALFRDHDLASKVSEERLTMLIRETATALLDPRLVVSSHNSLDEATCSQVVRAINKLAVQAATGGSREAALPALMTLQRQLSFTGTPLNARLSRVVTKLFSRVLKVEDASEAPWESTDLRIVLVALNNHFKSCNEHEEVAAASDRDAIAACSKVGKSLVESLVKAYPGASAIREVMTRVGIHPVASALGMVLQEYAPTDDESHASHHSQARRPATPSKGVGVLVNALGCAQSEEEREISLRDLRQYISEHGDSEFHAHLEEVSPAFRKFILEQLKEVAAATERVENASNASNMTERLRNLRSRLHSNDASNAALPQSRLPAPSPPKASVAVSSSHSVSVETASVSSRSETSRQSLRERLAAAQENRKNTIVQAETTSTAGSRAAALRARLQAVKQQAMEPKPSFDV